MLSLQSILESGHDFNEPCKGELNVQNSSLGAIFTIELPLHSEG